MNVFCSEITLEKYIDNRCHEIGGVYQQRLKDEPDQDLSYAFIQSESDFNSMPSELYVLFAEALSMMEHETWLTAEQALEKNLIDAVMFQKKEQEKFTLAAGPVFALPGKDKMEKFRKYKESEDNSVNKKALQQKLDYLKLKGEVR